MESVRMRDRSLLLRAREIINKSKEAVTGRAALKKALLERGMSLDAMAELLAGYAERDLGRLTRGANYDLTEQLGLFDVPEVIYVNTEDGLLFIPQDEATLGHIRQYMGDGHGYHSTQRLRFKRGLEQLALIAGEPDETTWTSAREKIQSALMKEDENAENAEVDPDQTAG